EPESASAAAPFRPRTGLRGEPEPPVIERLRHECPASKEQQPSGAPIVGSRICDADLVRHQPLQALPFGLRVERPDGRATGLRCVERLTHVYEMTTIRQTRWKNVGSLFPRRVGLRQWNCGAAVFAHAQQPTGSVPDDDVAVTVPRAAYGDARQIAQGLRRAARYIQLLEFVAGLERDEPSVRRPERRRCVDASLPAGQLADFQRIHRAEPDPRTP